MQIGGSIARSLYRPLQIDAKADGRGPSCAGVCAANI